MIKAQVETITPEMAENILRKHNVFNRKIQSKMVNKYATDMRNGDWKLNGEPIQFDDEGNLLNGQHRLMAITVAKVPVELLVVRGVDTGIHVYDTGKNRTYGDMLALDGFDRSRTDTTYISCARTMYVYGVNGSSVASYSEIKEFINRHSDSIDAAVRISHRGVARCSCKKARTSAFIATLAIAIEMGYSISKIEDFAHAVSTGFYEDETQTAAIVLRNQMIAGDLVPSDMATKAKTIRCTEKAIDDFCSMTPRKRKYKEDSHTFIDKWKESLKNE